MEGRGRERGSVAAVERTDKNTKDQFRRSNIQLQGVPGENNNNNKNKNRKEECIKEII